MPGLARRAALAAGVAAAIGLAGAMALAALPAGAGPLCGPACLERRMDAHLDAQGALPAAARPKVRALIRQELALSPFNTSAWLRLAALEADANGGRLSGTAGAALSASYRYAPIDPEVALWRTAFVFNHWGDAPPDVRTWAERETRLLAQRDPKAFANLMGQIRDPSGALAYRMLVGVDID